MKIDDNAISFNLDEVESFEIDSIVDHFNDEGIYEFTVPCFNIFRSGIHSNSKLCNSSCTYSGRISYVLGNF